MKKITMSILCFMNLAFAETQIIETNIVGDFGGWGGKTIVKLADGSIWQQCSSDVSFNGSGYNPKIMLISHDSTNYEMQVEGDIITVCVKRLK